jgi:hypothetical protein
MGGLGMIWNPYGFFGAGGLTKSPSDGIMRAKTATPPYISDTFSDTLGHIHILYLIILSLYNTQLCFLLHLINVNNYTTFSTTLWKTIRNHILHSATLQPISLIH